MRVIIHVWTVDLDNKTQGSRPQPGLPYSTGNGAKLIPNCQINRHNYRISRKIPT